MYIDCSDILGVKKFVPITLGFISLFALTGCASTPTVPQVRIEAQVTAPKTIEYELKVSDEHGTLRLDATMGKAQRIAEQVPASSRYRITVDTLKSQGVKKPWAHTRLCTLNTSVKHDSLVLVIAADGCHLSS